VVAAGVTYQVTRACTTGELLGCSCDRKMKNRKNKKRLKFASMPEGDWEWEGCGGENVDFGIKKSKDFLDTRYRKRSDMKTLVKLHNYVAGRLVSSDNFFLRASLQLALISTITKLFEQKKIWEIIKLIKKIL
jgi:hypothetical protein